MKHEAMAWSRKVRTVTPTSRPLNALNASAHAPSRRIVSVPESARNPVTTISLGE